MKVEVDASMLESPEELLARIRVGDALLSLIPVRLRGNAVDAPALDVLADELAAFANAGGGVLVLGVDDKTRSVQGIAVEQLDAVEAFAREVCQDSVKPPLMVLIERVQLSEPGGPPRAVVKIEIPRGLFVHKSPSGYLQRLGSSKREMGPDVLARLFQQRSQARVLRFDEQAVPGTTPGDLSPALWSRFRGEGEEEPLVTLDKLKLIARDDQQAWRATVAALLLCSEHPDRWLPGALIEAVHYGGLERDAHHQIDARTITGPLDRQINEALFFVERNMSVAAIKDPGRIDVPQYSLRAVFEAVVNAVAHRDWSVHGSKVRLFVFADRLELFSPGALANTLTLESLALRQSTRNELVASLLARCPIESRSDLGRARIMDKRGEGVPIILRESRRLSGREPRYDLIDDAELRLTIWAAALPRDAGRAGR